MQYILSLLPVLACPLGMGLLMWFMMRSNKADTDQAQGRPNPSMNPDSELPPAREPTIRGEVPQKPSVFTLFGMCLNWKVLVGLGVVGVLVFIVNPQIGLALVPLLLIAACPLSMLFMMRGMQRGTNSSTSPSSLAHHSSAIEASREERLTALHAHLGSLQAEQELLANQITQLEREEAERFSPPEAEGKTDTAINAERSQALPKW